MKLNVNDVVFSKQTEKALKIVAVIKKTTRRAENLVVVMDTKMDSMGRLYKIKDTERIMYQDSIRRRYFS